MKILIVEDEPALQELVQRTLEQERFVVEVASTYAEAAVKMGAYCNCWKYCSFSR